MKLVENLVMIGPGRLTERTVLNQVIEFEAEDLERAGNDRAGSRDRLLDSLRKAGLTPAAERFATSGDVSDSAEQLCVWYAETTILLQQWAGHRVALASVLPDKNPNAARVLIEFEESNVAMDAADLARELMLEAIRTDGSASGPGAIANKLEAFRAMARELVLPLDTEVLIEAAKALDVPCFRLDREPYEGVKGDFRIRDNGLLMFGHACYQHVVDGTVCIDRSAPVMPAASSRLSANRILRTHGLPTPRTDPHSETCISLSRARRSAGRIGYPVVVKPVTLRKGAVSCNIGSEDELQDAVRRAQDVGSGFLVEAHIPGDTYHMLFSGQQFLAVVDARGENDVSDLCDASLIESAMRLAEAVPAGMLVLDFVTTDPGRPLEETSGAFVGLQVAPELESILPPGGDLHQAMASGFVEWLFPEGRPCRVPLFSVTGTNGKTTTCRMLSAIMEKAGFRIGMACTDGIYLNGELTEKGDRSGGPGHHRVFESRDINLAVLETARGSVLHTGFIFDWSDVAICTNVTPEHLGEFGVETVEQMAEVKQMIVERARKAVVLNADDPLCRKIGGRLAGRRLCWCSAELSVAAFARKGLTGDRFLLLEKKDGEDWIVDYQAGAGTDVMRVGDIPATFGGLARHNVLNAMQAMTAALEFGIGMDVVRDALAQFAMGIETTPGRQNFHYGLGFPVLMDFVQTIDGMRRFCEFAGALEIEGQRILVISVLGRHDDDTIRGFASYAATAFDRFICRNYGYTFERDEAEIPNLLRDQLLKEGVEDASITIIHNDTEAMDAALGMAREGDLVAIMCGHEFKKYWQEISSFPERSQAKEEATPS